MPENQTRLRRLRWETKSMRSATCSPNGIFSERSLSNELANRGQEARSARYLRRVAPDRIKKSENVQSNRSFSGIRCSWSGFFYSKSGACRNTWEVSKSDHACGKIMSQTVVCARTTWRAAILIQWLIDVLDAYLPHIGANWLSFPILMLLISPLRHNFGTKALAMKCLLTKSHVNQMQYNV